MDEEDGFEFVHDGVARAVGSAAEAAWGLVNAIAGERKQTFIPGRTSDAFALLDGGVYVFEDEWCEWADEQRSEAFDEWLEERAVDGEELEDDRLDALRDEFESTFDPERPDDVLADGTYVIGRQCLRLVAAHGRIELPAELDAGGPPVDELRVRAERGEVGMASPEDQVRLIQNSASPHGWEYLLAHIGELDR